MSAVARDQVWEVTRPTGERRRFRVVDAERCTPLGMRQRVRGRWLHNNRPMTYVVDLLREGAQGDPVLVEHATKPYNPFAVRPGMHGHSLRDPVRKAPRFKRPRMSPAEWRALGGQARALAARGLTVAAIAEELVQREDVVRELLADDQAAKAG